MTATPTSLGRPLHLTLICCESCGEWREWCVCTDVAVRAPEGSPLSPSPFRGAVRGACAHDTTCPPGVAARTRPESKRAAAGIPNSQENE